MEQKYGDRFFYETKPILLVHNQTLNYSFEIEIDDFTNSWYLHTPTSDCIFNIELGRKKITNCNFKRSCCYRFDTICNRIVSALFCYSVYNIFVTARRRF